LDPGEINRCLEWILPTVQKPGRYTGGELNQIVKDWQTTPVRVALAFPDIYDIGMPNLGLSIFYESLNQRSDVLAERVYLPWVDMEMAMRKEGVPLYSLESHHPIADFNLLAITLPYESLYTNVLNLLDLSAIPIFAGDRDDTHPLVVAGGHAAFNPEPMAPFVDAFAIGEGEELIHELVNSVSGWKGTGQNRKNLLHQLASIPGVYVPSLYENSYHPDGTLAATNILAPGIPKIITKRIVSKLPPPPTRLIVPSIDVVHNRVSVEIMRGCSRGCRFCHAGMVTRPVRERPLEQVLSSITEALKNTGYEEVALLSLSSSDYTNIVDLVDKISQLAANLRLIISLPSLRIESFSIDLMEKLRDSRQGGFTLAPEAATERMRNIINKPITTQQLLSTARAIYSRGWNTIKLYFMIGHPSETLEDVQAIANLCQAVIAEGRKIIGKRAGLHAGVSTFVPKAHTPFQWVACESMEHIEEKLNLLRCELRGPGLKMTWTDPKDTMLEAWLSRGDRRLAQVIYLAWKNGAMFDAWQEHFNYSIWMDAFAQTGVDPDFYTLRQRQEDEVFPWDHISPGVSKAYLLKEYQRSQAGILTSDCREHCSACGILPAFAPLRRKHSGDSWKCPDVQHRKARPDTLLAEK